MRRYDQLGSMPAQQPAEVIRDLQDRDQRDRNRANSPLKAAPDAVLLDSTHLTLQEVLEAAEAIVAAKLALVASAGRVPPRSRCVHYPRQVMRSSPSYSGCIASHVQRLNAIGS